MALPATDAFTAADGTSLPTYSANWSVNAGSFAINTNAVYSTTANECGAGWNADTFDANQYAQGVITARAAPLIGVAVRVHTDGTTDTYYGYYGSNGTSQLFKQVAATWTQLGSSSTAFAVNDIVKLTANGTTLTPTRNGSTTGTPGAQTDTSIASGRAGLSAYDAGSGSRLDSWEGGNLAVAFQPRPPAAIDSLMVY